jgi:hypothetical protein
LDTSNLRWAVNPPARILQRKRTWLKPDSVLAIAGFKA